MKYSAEERHNGPRQLRYGAPRGAIYNIVRGFDAERIINAIVQETPFRY
jgi:hypothetical protein